jgi:hypothetical protein
MGQLPISDCVWDVRLIQGSYVEGIVRGYRNGLLSGSAYNNLTQCETIDGMSMNTTLTG